MPRTLSLMQDWRSRAEHSQLHPSDLRTSTSDIQLSPTSLYLRGLNCIVDTGKYVDLVGASRCGTSTATQLVEL